MHYYVVGKRLRVQKVLRVLYSTTEEAKFQLSTETKLELEKFDEREKIKETLRYCQVHFPFP